MFNYRAFYEFTKGVICPETANEPKIKDARNDSVDKIAKINSAIELMEIILGGEDVEN